MFSRITFVAGSLNVVLTILNPNPTPISIAGVTSESSPIRTKMRTQMTWMLRIADFRR